MAPTRRVVGIEQGQVARHGGPYRLLIAEDDEPGRRLLVRLFEPLGVDIREAQDGREAIAKWQSWKPDLIWMDMQMPVIDGHEATRQIRAAGDSGTVIVALSASAFEQDRERVLAEGCDDFVRKPFRAEELFAMLTKHLGVRFIFEDVAPPETASSSRWRRAGSEIAGVIRFIGPASSVGGGIAEGDDLGRHAAVVERYRQGRGIGFGPGR